MRLKNKTVLITGAGGQLGGSLVKSFANEGAKIWLADISEEAMINVENKILSPNILGKVKIDVTDPKSVESVFEYINKKEHLDVLVNNAGVGVFTPFWEREYKDFLNVFSVNAGGTFLCTREYLRYENKGRSGSIINIGSIYGIISSDPRIYTDCNRMNSEAYSASKAAVIHLTKYFAVHAAPLGVRINCVSPGGIFNNQGSDFVKNYSDKTPFNRMAKENEICGAVVFLASDDSNYVTGQNIVVDGGFTSW